MSLCEKTMGFLFLCLLWAIRVFSSKCAVQQMETFATEGHAVRLHCLINEHLRNFTFMWTKDNYTVKASPRVKVQGDSLWFLSTVSSDSGLYVCVSTDVSVITETRVFLSVEKQPCPRTPDLTLALEGTNINLTCSEDPIETLGQILERQWWKECKPTGMQSSELSLKASMSSSGNYTCLIIFRHEGENYTASHTFQLRVVKNEPVDIPKVLHPRNQTVHIKPGEKTKLECRVFIGSGVDVLEETFIYWTVDDEYIDRYAQLEQNLTFEKNQIYATSTLFISEVFPNFFDVPFKCIVLNSGGTDMGLVWLRQGDQSTSKTVLTISLVSIIVIVVGIVLLILFKIDIILAFRHLRDKGKTGTQGGKKYNAYVAFVASSSRTEELALRIMPEVLEQQHDLKLFIHGRDDANSEVSVAEITDALSQSKTVLLVLPGSGPANGIEEESYIPLSSGRDKPSVSYCLDLSSVIAQSGAPVSVVETGANADYSLLPESLQSIIQRDKVLKWSPAVQPSGRFWKLLRYQMT